MNQILVTGGAGFIGTGLCKKLLSLGNKVVVIDNFITSSDKNLKQFQGNPNYKFIRHDITDPNWKLKIEKWKFDLIYHLACPTGVPNIKTLGEEMLLTCSLGTMNVLDIARRHKAKLLFTSSSEVYGDPEVFPQDEEYSGNVSPVGERSPYEEGKRFSETLVKNYVNKYGIDAKIVRVFNTYGPFSSNKETRVVPKFLRLALNGKPITVEGKGLQTRTFCYVDDLIEGLILVMNKGKKGEAYNIGSDREISIKDLAEIILLITKSKSRIISIPRPAHDHNRRLPDLRKIKALGWNFNTGIYEGLKRTLQ